MFCTMYMLVHLCIYTNVSVHCTVKHNAMTILQKVNIYISGQEFVVKMNEHFYEKQIFLTKKNPL